jgi:hypothetical protein
VVALVHGTPGMQPVPLLLVLLVAVEELVPPSVAATLELVDVDDAVDIEVWVAELNRPDEPPPVVVVRRTEVLAPVELVEDCRATS